MLEPPVPGRAGRYNDIRIQVAPGSQISNFDLDVTVASLTQVHHTSTINAQRGYARVHDPLQDDDPAPPDATSEPAALLALVKKKVDVVLTREAQDKFNNQGPPGTSAPTFAPFVLSAGGLTWDDSQSRLQRWRSLLPSSSYGHLIRSMSIALLRSRDVRPGYRFPDAQANARPTLGLDVVG